MRYLSIIGVLLISCMFGASAQEQYSLANFKHLEHLTEKIWFDHDTVSIVHIYSNYPSYHWVDAKESGPEGIACVDDASRAAVVMLRRFELTHDTSSLSEARMLLKFVAAMETDDGEFYNFIYADHSINRNGKTSVKSFGWWAARGVWCMSLGYLVFKDVDTAFASRLKDGITRTFPHIEALLKKYGEAKRVDRLRIPEWLVYDSGADVTSELLLGLTAYYQATEDPRVKMYIEKFADGLMMMQDGDATTFPYGLHRSWETMWHMWGNDQTQALASAGLLLNDSAMIRSGEKEARGFYSRLLIHGYMKELDIAHPDSSVHNEQIAYGIRPIAVGLLRLYDATKDPTYLTMAGLAASWFFGNNIAHRPMYDVLSGRCFDGIIDSLTINRNSGAESTIEALHTLVEIDNYPGAKKYMGYKKVGESTQGNSLLGTFQNQSGDEVILTLDTVTGVLTMQERKHGL
ncbi:MAG TPA: hypothetical protein VMM58_00650 [Bacteroidota bacterium]|nr:hypothetical protein [Bacteroidota bacterium]